MKKSLLYRNTPVNYVFVVLLAILAGSIRYTLALKEPLQLTDYNFVFGLISIKAVPAGIDALVISALFLLIAVVGNAINNRFLIVESAFQRPSFLIICFSAIIISGFGVVPALLSLFLILAALARILPMFRKENANSNAFDAGILVSLAGLISSYAFIFLTLIAIAMFSLRSIQRKEVFALILGLATPLLFLFFGLYFFDYMPVFEKAFLSHRPLTPDLNKYSVANLISTASPLFLSFVALIDYSLASGFKKVITRRYQGIVFYFAGIAIIVMTLPLQTPGSAVFLLFPVSLALSQLFVGTRSLWLRYFVWIVYLANVAGLLFFRINGVYQ